jgi:DNA helicase-2/ATP-dependent DNA helicase PcrA
LLFIDEVQDNSEEQSKLLYRLFAEGANPVTRQRFGDSNQAIYQYSGQSDGVTTDPFPNMALVKSIPNSHRFAQQIADFADPLAVCPPDLVGVGPRSVDIRTNTTGRHAVFLFDDQTVGFVMRCYATYLQELFTGAELRTGTFTAVGAVHRPAQNDKIPRSVGHYWPAYDHQLTALDPRPSTLLQYLLLGKRLELECGEAFPMVEKTAEGILRLAALQNPLADLTARKLKHRYVRERLKLSPDRDQDYLEVLSALLVTNSDRIVSDWADRWAPRLAEIAAGIAGPGKAQSAVAAFLELPAGSTQQPSSSQSDNIFRYPLETASVQIRVGSIHSIKGETHTATLVLDTFFYAHHLSTLIPWLVGEASGGTSESFRVQSRLRQHYVAMTRPSHLLCLAMREDSLTGGNVSTLMRRGWRVARAAQAGPVWL